VSKKTKTPRRSRSTKQSSNAKARKLEQKARSGKPAIADPVPSTERPVTVPPELPDGFTPAQLAFCLEYLENGFNATAAYRAAHPDCTPGTAAVEGWRTLRNPKIARWLKGRTETVWKDLQLGAEEALARVGFAATFDVGSIFDEKDKLLPVSQWPLEIRQLVESVDLEKGKVRFTSRAQALRIILEQSGKLSSLAGSVDELAAAIRADKEEHREAMHR
jgi:phage terminase small subunit